MRLADWLIGLILIAAGAALYSAAQTLPQLHGQRYGAGFFPSFIAAGFVLVGALMTASDLRRAGPALMIGSWVRSGGAWMRLSCMVLGTIAFILLLDRIGYLASVLLLLGLLMPVCGVRWRVAIPVSLIAALGSWYLFGRVLRVALPYGLLEPHIWF